MPDGCSDILLSTGGGEQPRLTLVGLMTTPQVLDVPAGKQYFGVRFHPGMAAVFVREAPLLNDRVESLDALWGSQANSLLSNLLDSREDPWRSAVAMERHLRPLESPPEHDAAIARLAVDGFTSDLSDRHLRSRIRCLGEAVDWADLPVCCGYFDQAHLIRDFREFASMTPGRHLQSRCGLPHVESICGTVQT